MAHAVRTTLPRTRRPQARGLATRARILRSAEELFTRGGYDGTSIHDVAERAGIGVGTVYHHFPDKRAVLLALVADWGDRIAARRRSDLGLERLLSEDPRASIERALRRAHERQRKEPSLYVVVLALADRDEDVRRLYDRIEQVQIERLAEFVAFGQQQGAFRARVDPASAGFLIHHAIDMAATQLLVREIAQPTPDRILSELAEMICSYLLEATR